ncbi:hypothetical protein [Campylobacter sp.]|uniref:hypothetical protein n=1 Tax=Campylobacter sp. TaxID=205 RepID=UPI0026DAA96B|nr:hypothetical protein [Campylobacter sp.]MDO4674691.1 hypothetical protein [Campylobacter sp.]
MPVFSPAQKELFERNLRALKNSSLRAALAQLVGGEFRAIVGAGELDLNLADTGGGGGGKIYQKPLGEVRASLEL